MTGECGRREMHAGLGGETSRWPLGRPRHRWDYNIKMDLKETERESVESM